jgi:hypothetical protein
MKVSVTVTYRVRRRSASESSRGSSGGHGTRGSGRGLTVHLRQVLNTGGGARALRRGVLRDPDAVDDRADQTVVVANLEDFARRAVDARGKSVLGLDDGRELVVCPNLGRIRKNAGTGEPIVSGQVLVEVDGGIEEGDLKWIVNACSTE